MKIYGFMVAAISAVILAALPWCAGAQAPAYPAGSVTIVVPYPPGGPYDILARLFQPRLAEVLKQPVIVENKGGANGNIGAEAVAHARPDGYTLLLLGSVHAINMSLYKSLNYQLNRDLVPVAPFGSAAFILLVPADLDVKSAGDLFALAKKSPGALNYASGGSGSVGHLAAVQMNQMAGTKMTHVPYKGSGPALVDLMAGRVSVFFNTIPASLPHLKGGKLKGLAVTSRKRSPLVADLPTLAEVGLAGYEAVAWFGLAAPAGTPADVVGKLNAAVQEIQKTPEMQKRMAEQGIDPMFMGPQEFATFVRGETGNWAKIVRESGATVD